MFIQEVEKIHNFVSQNIRSDDPLRYIAKKFNLEVWVFYDASVQIIKPHTNVGSLPVIPLFNINNSTGIFYKDELCSVYYDNEESLLLDIYEDLHDEKTKTSE